MRKIDIFNQIWPPAFFAALTAHPRAMSDITKRAGDVPMMTDLLRRFAVMDMFWPGYHQILSFGSPYVGKGRGPGQGAGVVVPWHRRYRRVVRGAPGAVFGLHRDDADEQPDWLDPAQGGPILPVTLPKRGRSKRSGGPSGGPTRHRRQWRGWCFRGCLTGNRG